MRRMTTWPGISSTSRTNNKGGAVLVIHPLRLIYIRVPKTASTSFVNTLDELDPQHLGDVHGNACEVDHLMRKGHVPKDYKKVGAIRHPYRWMQSAFNHHRNNPDMFNVEAVNIKQFIRAVRATPMDWLSLDGELYVDEVWRAEDMDDIVLSLGLEPRRMNVKTYDYPLDDDDKNLINERCSREMAYYVNH